MSGQVGQMFPPAKFTEKGLPDQEGKVRDLLLTLYINTVAVFSGAG